MRSSSARLLAPALIGAVSLLAVAVLGPRSERTSLGAEPAPLGERTAPEGTQPVARTARRLELRAVDGAQASEPADGPEAARQEWRVRVVEEGGTPIAGAFVGLPGGDRLLRTGAEGRVAFESSPAAETCVVSVSAAGFIARRVLLTARDRESPVPREVRLLKGVSLAGSVVDPEGRSVGAGVALVAVDSVGFLNPTRIERALLGVPTVPFARTDSSGSFRLTGLNPRVGYRLLAAGRGFVSFDPFGPPVDLQADSPLVVRASHLYGCRVLLQGCGAPQVATLSGPWFPRADVRGTGIRRLDLLGCLPLLLDGLPCGPTDRGAMGRLFLFATDQDLPSVDFLYGAELPGCSPVSRSLSAPPVLGEVVEHRVAISQVTAGFGQVQVRLDGGAVAFSSFGLRPGPLTVRLRSDTSELAAEVTLDESGKGVLRGVPYGRYAASAEIACGFFEWPAPGEPALLVDVGEGGAQVAIPVADRGALELSVLARDGMVYAGPLQGSLALRRGGEQYVDAFFFPRPPYGFSLLPAGVYAVALLDEVLADAPVVHVSAGGKSVLEMRLTVD